MSLERGQKIKIANIVTGNKLSIEISAYDNHGLIYDMSVFGLDVSGKCSDEDYFIFYNQRQSPEGSIDLAQKVDENKENFNIFLDRIPVKINRLVFTLTVDGNDNMSKLSNGALIISDINSQVCSFNFKGADFNSERAIMIGELYFINNEWRFGAIGQGFNGGLSSLWLCCTNQF